MDEGKKKNENERREKEEEEEKFTQMTHSVCAFARCLLKVNLLDVMRRVVLVYFYIDKSIYIAYLFGRYCWQSSAYLQICVHIYLHSERCCCC
jgi:hypothetical protein